MIKHLDAWNDDITSIFSLEDIDFGSDEPVDYQVTLDEDEILAILENIQSLRSDDSVMLIESIGSGPYSEVNYY